MDYISLVRSLNWNTSTPYLKKTEPNFNEKLALQFLCLGKQAAKLILSKGW